MRVIQDDVTEMMLSKSQAVITTTTAEPATSLPTSSSSRGSLADLAENDPNLRPSILKQLLQNLSFAQSDLDGETFAAVVWDSDDDDHKEEERQDSNIETPPSPPSPPVHLPRHGSSSNNNHQLKSTPVKKKSQRRSPGYSRRTPSPHFLSRKQMSQDGILTVPSSSISTTKGGSSSTGDRKPLPRHVRFNTPSNVVVLVETRNEFDSSTKQAMWTDAKELQDQVYRNKMEYLAEGMDPLHVLEDDDFYRDLLTGELIHPYWIEQATDPEDITTIAVDDIDGW